MGNFEFQSTRPRGRTRLPGLINRLIKKVSIHASSREDATSYWQSRRYSGQFQSTRPRGRTRLYINIL